MSEEMIREIFLEIAFRAMELNKSISLEKGKSSSKSTIFGGAFSSSDMNNDSLILSVERTNTFDTEPDEEEAEE